MFVQAEPAQRDVELALDSTRLRVGDARWGVLPRAEGATGWRYRFIGEALAAGFGVIYVCDVDTLEAVKKPLVTEAIAVGRGHRERPAAACHVNRCVPPGWHLPA